MSGRRARKPSAGKSRELVAASGFTVALVSLGCPKNLVDSEGMAGVLEGTGFRPAGSTRGADVLLINTCSFIGDATEESLNSIEDALRLKREGSVRAVVAAGCLVERMGQALFRKFPELDGGVGTRTWPHIGEVCIKALSGRKTVPPADAPTETPVPLRSKSSHGHFGYLKVTEGCHRHCSYCVIPSLRGPLRTTPPESILEEAEALAASGVVELVLVGEDIGAYGAGGGDWNLARLLGELNRLPGVEWIRMLYVHPASVDRGLLAAAEECEKVCPYIDVPIQHASDRVLERMNRPTSRRDLERVMRMIKKSRKDFAIRTTVMVGFPGETEEDFSELESFVAEWEFDHLGAFCYSAECGTAAVGYADQVDRGIAEERRSRIMELQSKISLNANRTAVGSLSRVLVDGEGDGGLLVARTDRQAPQIDGVTLVSGADCAPGDFLTVRITDAGAYDLYAAAEGGGET